MATSKCAKEGSDEFFDSLVSNGIDIGIDILS